MIINTLWICEFCDVHIWMNVITNTDISHHKYGMVAFQVSISAIAYGGNLQPQSLMVNHRTQDRLWLSFIYPKFAY